MTGSKRVARLQRKARTVETARAEAATVAVGYLRVSSEEQAASGFSLAAQEEALRAFAISQGLELLEVVSDPGVSGATRPADRPGFQRVLELAAAGAVSTVLVWRFDRLARHLSYAVETAAALQDDHAVSLRSVTEPIDTASPIGQMIFAVFAGMAAQEREAIAERTLMGKREKARRGGFAGGRAPFGYRKGPEGALVVDEAEAAVVRRIFAMRADGATLKAICDALNADGAFTRAGARWHPPQVGYVIDNAKYRGKVEYFFRAHGPELHIVTDGRHEALVVAVPTRDGPSQPLEP